MPKSWRDVLPIHPAAELFPLMSPDELKALGEDIRKNALTSPIALWRASPAAQLQLLDGRNRLDAIEIIDKCPAIKDASQIEAVIKQGKAILLHESVDPYAYVISANIHRRHLTAEQKRELIAKLLKATPEKSNRQIAETVKADDKTVGSVRRALEGRAEIPHVETRTDTKGRQQPSKKATPKSPPSTKPIIDKPPTQRARGDTGPASKSEIEPKDAELELGELRSQKRRLEIENAELARKIEDYGKDFAAMRDKFVALSASADDGLDSAGELARLRALVNELQAENQRLKSEIEESRRPASEAVNGEAGDADAVMLGSLLKAWDRAPEPVREKFMARAELVRHPLAIPPSLDRRPRRAVP